MAEIENYAAEEMRGRKNNAFPVLSRFFLTFLLKITRVWICYFCEANLKFLATQTDLFSSGNIQSCKWKPIYFKVEPDLFSRGKSFSVLPSSGLQFGSHPVTLVGELSPPRLGESVRDGRSRKLAPQVF